MAVAQPNKIPSTLRHVQMVKLLLVGDSGVGKSCCLLRWCDDTFSPSFIATVGIDFKVRTMWIGDGRASVQVWDTAGQEKFQTITRAYYRGAMGVLIVYDVTNEQSFKNARTWISEVEQHARENVLKILVGNKCDANDERVVSTEQGQSLASELGIPFIEVSAWGSINIEEAFETLVTAIDKQYLSAQQNLEAQHQQQVVNIGCRGFTPVGANKQCC